jgi:riboflavin kinase/FMN adenylyltransferase
MNVVHSLGEVQFDRNSVVTVGTFDGVHLAHREIIREAIQRAKMRGGRSVVVTFDPHPKEVVGGRSAPIRLLSTVDEKLAQFQALGVDLALVINFTYDFSRLTARDFYQRYVIEGIGVSDVILGYDHMFGRDRGGGIEQLVRMGREFDFSVFAVHPVTMAAEVVSSSLIRKTLLEGEVERARIFLGYPYMMRGKVVKGDGRGKALGYPTANLEPLSKRKLIPRKGVYLVSVRVATEGYYGMMNIGVRPTVTDGLRETIEVHILDFHGDLYGHEVEVKFLSRIRDEQKFGSRGELVEQLDRDLQRSREYIAAISQNAKQNVSH